MPNLPGLRALEASGNEAGGKGPHALDASVRVSGFRVLGASFGFIWEFPKIRGTLLLFRLLYSGPLLLESPIYKFSTVSTWAVRYLYRDPFKRPMSKRGLSSRMGLERGDLLDPSELVIWFRV